MIRLKDDWVIGADSACYMLGKAVEVERKNKDGTAYTATEIRDPSYHATIGQAATAFVRKIQRDLVQSNDYTIKDAVKALQGVADEVQSMLTEEV